MGLMGEDYDDLLERLRTLSDELGDRAFGCLMGAADPDEPDARRTELLAEEKALGKARRAVDRAIAVLTVPDSADP